MNKAEQGWEQGRQEAQSTELGRGLDPTVAIPAPPWSRDGARYRPRIHVIPMRGLCRSAKLFSLSRSPRFQPEMKEAVRKRLSLELPRP